MAQNPLDFSGSDLIINNIYQGASTQGQAGTLANESALSGITAGTVTASKAVIVDSSKNIATLGTVGSGAITSTGASSFGSIVTTSGGIAPITGTATIAPITLTAGTNLTTAAAGAVEFDGTAFYATSVASSRQQVDAEQFIIATANSATYNNTGLDTAVAAPVFTSTTNAGVSAGAVTLAAGKTYAFEAVYNLTNTGTTSHTWATVLAGSATFNTGSGYQAYGASGVTASTPITGSLTGFINSTTLTTPVVCTAASTSATEQVTITQTGVLIISAGGTLIPQLKASARPGASGTPGVIVLAGSYFRIWEMGNSNFVGNWS